MADVTGGNPPTGGDEFKPHEDIAAAYSHFGDASMFYVADAAALPTSGNWYGRRLRTQDLNIEYWWDGSAWVAWDSPWINYTPASSTINVGAGTRTARYRYVNGRVQVHVVFKLGSGFSITGTANVALPVARTTPSHAYEPLPELGHAFSLVTPTTTNYRISVVTDNLSTTVVYFGYGLSQIASDVTSTNPFTFESGDVIEALFSYDPA